MDENDNKYRFQDLYQNDVIARAFHSQMKQAQKDFGGNDYLFTNINTLSNNSKNKDSDCASNSEAPSANKNRKKIGIDNMNKVNKIHLIDDTIDNEIS